MAWRGIKEPLVGRLDLGAHRAPVAVQLDQPIDDIATDVDPHRVSGSHAAKVCGGWTCGKVQFCEGFQDQAGPRRAPLPRPLSYDLGGLWISTSPWIERRRCARS